MICLLLGMLVVAVYWPVAHYGFVDYDDGDYVTANQHVQGGVTWKNIVWAFTTGHASNWHPLTWLSHMLDWQLFGSSAGPQHLVNVVFHLVNTLLVFFVLRRITGEHWRSAFVAAIFAVHPLHVESVAWISERKDVLSAFFFLLTLGAYGLYVQSGRAAEAEPSGQSTNRPATSNDKQGVINPAASEMQPYPGRALSPKAPPRSTDVPLHRSHAKTPEAAASGTGKRFYALALVCFALGLMSKPMLVTVPFVLLLLDYWPFNRMGISTGTAEPLGILARRWTGLVIEKLPFFALAFISSGVTYIVQQKGGAVSTVLTLPQRLANADVSYARYLAKTFWPVNLSVLYPHPGNWAAWQVLGALLVVLCVCGLAIWHARSRPYLIVGWLWFLGMLVPVIGVVQVGIQSMADRYMYVPLIGLAMAVAWGFAELVRGRGVVVGASAVVVVCSLLAVKQVEFWKDSETLFRHAVEVTPGNYLAYNNLGYYLSNHGRPAEAMQYYLKSIEINPLYEDALNNMGYVLAGQKRHAEAIPYYEAALRVKPNHVEVNNNLGNALSELGRIPEAIEHYNIALKFKPDHADAHNNLGIALAMQGKLDEAIPHFRDAIRFRPGYASAHSNLGNALAAQQKFQDAIVEYNECLRLNPQDPQAHNNLANVLSQQGKLEPAIEHYNQALRLNPENPEAHFNLSMALLRQNKIAEARSHLVEALRLNPGYTAAQRQLALLDSTSK